MGGERDRHESKKPRKLSDAFETVFGTDVSTDYAVDGFCFHAFLNENGRYFESDVPNYDELI